MKWKTKKKKKEYKAHVKKEMVAQKKEKLIYLKKRCEK